MRSIILWQTVHVFIAEQNTANSSAGNDTQQLCHMRKINCYTCSPMFLRRVCCCTMNYFHPLDFHLRTLKSGLQDQDFCILDRNFRIKTSYCYNHGVPHNSNHTAVPHNSNHTAVPHNSNHTAVPTTRG
ncbi:hypothetical protein FHG87_004447 [Trinorchestia longiramus]|nr:hypothetical protein FHG87_004447 [Trinorchestia longiramus]